VPKGKVYFGVISDTLRHLSLHHEELLEAAHIVSDKHPLGEPIIPNGVTLCKLHHAAFERNILGISPDYVIDIRRDILEETDGPMLKFGLQQTMGQIIQTPKVLEWEAQQRFVGHPV